MHFLSFLVIVLQNVVVLFAFRDFPANSSVSFSNQRLRSSRASVFADPFRNVLSRKKRFFVFYKGTVVVLTDVCALSIPGGTPRALVQSNEIDIFYDVPLLVEGWRKPVDDFVEHLKAKSREDQEASKEDEALKNVGVVNASAIPLKEYNKLANMRPSWSHYPVKLQNYSRVWETSRRKYPSLKWRPDYRPDYRSDYRPNYRPNHRPDYNPYYQNSHRRNYMQPRPTTTDIPTTPMPSTPKQAIYDAYEETDRSLHEIRRSVEANPQKWHNHREYRERRALYDHLEAFGKMLGVSLRKCIQRAICEMKEQLLPEGESLINDIARILFTVPTEHDEEDEFTKIAREENVDCARRFVVSCPHSPLHYFHTHFKATGHPTRPPTAEDAINSVIYA